MTQVVKERKKRSVLWGARYIHKPCDSFIQFIMAAEINSGSKDTGNLGHGRNEKRKSSGRIINDGIKQWAFLGMIDKEFTRKLPEITHPLNIEFMDNRQQQQGFFW